MINNTPFGENTLYVQRMFSCAEGSEGVRNFGILADRVRTAISDKNSKGSQAFYRRKNAIKNSGVIPDEAIKIPGYHRPESITYKNGTLKKFIPKNYDYEDYGGDTQWAKGSNAVSGQRESRMGWKPGRRNRPTSERTKRIAIHDKYGIPIEEAMNIPDEEVYSGSHGDSNQAYYKNRKFNPNAGQYMVRAS